MKQGQEEVKSALDAKRIQRAYPMRLLGLRGRFRGAAVQPNSKEDRSCARSHSAGFYSVSFPPPWFSQSWPQVTVAEEALATVRRFPRPRTVRTRAARRSARKFAAWLARSPRDPLTRVRMRSRTCRTRPARPTRIPCSVTVEQRRQRRRPERRARTVMETRAPWRNPESPKARNQSTDGRDC